MCCCWSQPLEPCSSASFQSTPRSTCTACTSSAYYEEVEGDKSIAKVNIIHCSSFIHQLVSSDHWTVWWLSVIFPSQFHAGPSQSSFCPSCVRKWFPRWVAWSPLQGLSWSGSACSLLDFFLLLKMGVIFLFSCPQFPLWIPTTFKRLNREWPCNEIDQLPHAGGCIPSGSMDLCMPSLFKCSLTSFSSSEGSSSSSLESICLDSLQEGLPFPLP